MGIAFVNARVAPLWVAEKEGFFRKNGIDIKLTNIPGGTQGAQALLSGQFFFFFFFTFYLYFIYHLYLFFIFSSFSSHLYLFLLIITTFT